MEQADVVDPLIGAQVGNYEVRQKLGEGGMGSVYLAEHPLIGKKVALKVLHAEFASNQDVVSRFFNEAKAVNDIQHPNIVDIIDYGVIPQADGNSMVYFIMEFLAGTSLSQLIREQSPLAPERALRICIQIADALGASHRSNIVHRDLKPDNVILIKRRHEPDFVKVLDFGIAKLTGDQPGSRRTRTGIVMGTPAYMSPEQCEGRGEVDHRTDVYALGILLYEMLTGKVPFDGEGYGEVLVQHLTQPPMKPSTIRGVIPPHVEAVCLRALEKRSSDRYPSMDDFMRALSDPVAYVEAAGGIEHFTTANLGAPDMTPYPAAAVAPLTPLPGTLQPAMPTPMPQPMPQSATWPTPPPAEHPWGGPGNEPNKSKLPLIIGSVVGVIAIAVAAFIIFGGGDDKKTAASGDGDTDGTAIGSGTAEGTGTTDGTAAGTGTMDGTGTTDGTGATDGTAAGTGTMDGTGAGTADGTGAGSGSTADTTVPPEPEFVTIDIKTTPSGAEVFKKGERKRLGKTPFKWKIEKTDGVTTLILKRKRYDDYEVEVETNITQRLAFELKKTRRGGTSGKGKGSGTGKGSGKGSGKGTYGKDGTVDPFK